MAYTKNKARVFNFNGKDMTLNQISMATGIKYICLYHDIVQLGMNPQQSLNERSRDPHSWIGIEPKYGRKRTKLTQQYEEEQRTRRAIQEEQDS